jgi:hypothetical protein
MPRASNCAQIGSSMLPSIDAGGQAVRQRALGVPIPALGAPTLLYDTFVGQLQASYTLDLFGAARFANRALAKRVDVSAFQLESARRALAANIVTASITVSVLNAQIATTERLVALANDQAHDAQRRYALGSASRSDALNAQQSADTFAASLPALRQQRDTARHALAVLIGRTPDRPPADLTLADLHLPDEVPVVVPSGLLHSRPDIQAAEAGCRRGRSRRRDRAAVPAAVAVGGDRPGRLQLAGDAVGRRRDLERRRIAEPAAVPRRRAARAAPGGEGQLRGGRRSVPADRAGRVPERRRFARRARARCAGAAGVVARGAVRARRV